MKTRNLITFFAGMLISITAFAQTFTANTPEGVEMTFKVISESDKTCMVGDENGEFVSPFPSHYNGSITIPSEVNGYTVKRIGKWAFSRRGGLTSVTIPETVESIGTQAFNYTGLTAITLPSNLKTIEERVFQGCTGITSVTIPASVTRIANGIFDAGVNLASIEVESGNQVYDSRNDCNAIIETATNSLIQGCKNTTIPNTVNIIAEEAFVGCAGLTSIDIPSSVTSIAHRAFYYTGLTSITIPSSVEYFNGSALTGCSELASIIVESGNQVYDSRNDCNAIIETATNSLIRGCKNTTIPNTVKIIADGAFSECTGLTSIDIPSSVTSIKGMSFSGSGLTSITIPNSVTSIGYYAFSYTGLTSITIPSSVTDIDRAFATCRDLTSIIVDINNPVFDSRNNCNAIIETSSNSLIAGCINTVIPETVTSIAAEAFRSQSLMTSISIPASVIRIDDCFMECHNLTSVTVNNPVPFSMAEEAFIDRANITLYVPAGSVELYRLADNWRDFKEIKEIGADVVFTAQTAEGVDMTFKVISENEKTCMVGDENGEFVSPFPSDYNGGVTIPSVVNGYTVTRIGKWAFSWRGGLTSVSIPETVESIGTQAFNFTGLTAITLPGNLKTIEDYVFQGCTGITSVTIPASVTRIADGTFDAGNMNLASIEVENGNQVYDSRNDCNAIIETATNTLIQGCKNSTIPNTVNIIADEAFINCTGLTSIIIPEGVTSIGYRAFCGCSNLASVSLPENLETIDGDAFGGCKSLTSIVIPASVTSIGDYIFARCIGLTSIVVEDGNTVYDCRDNCSAIIETSTNTLIAGCKNTIIPNTVTCIGNGAFNDLTNLTSIEIPSSVTTLKWWAFHDCGLTSINIPAGMTTIEAGAFEACDNLTSVTVNNPVPVDLSCGGIHTSYVFSNYANATLYVPVGSKSAYEAADYWKDFKEIKEIGADVVFTAQTAEGVEMTFKVISENEKTCMVGDEGYGIASIRTDYSGSITIPSVVNGYTVTTIGDFAFCHCESLTSISIPKTVTIIKSNSFDGCALTSITLPSSVLSIGNNPFSCSSLTSIVVEEGNERYDSRDNCNAIIETATNKLVRGCLNTVIPNSVTSIGDSAFEGIPGLTSIEIPNRVTCIEGEAFCGTGLTSIDIPSSVTSIGYRAFLDCENMPSVSLSENLKTIDTEAFRGCNGLTSINIPEGVTNIESYAFLECHSLTSVTVNNPNPISLSDDQDLGFDRGNAVLYVPAGCRDAYANANYWRDFKEIKEIFNTTDISQLDNVIYIVPFTARVGDKAQMDICLKNANAATAYVFDLVLPEGITVAKNDNGKYIDELSNRHEDHTRTFNYKGENIYSFSTLSGNSEELTGNDGAIRLVTIEVPENMAEGDYAIEIKNASYSKPDGTLVTLPDTRSAVTVEDYIMGDVNGNGGVDIGDAVSIVNYLVGKSSTNFVDKAADTNKNGQIDIGDAVTVVNLLVGKIAGFTREYHLIWDDKEPE